VHRSTHSCSPPCDGKQLGFEQPSKGWSLEGYSMGMHSFSRGAKPSQLQGEGLIATSFTPFDCQQQSERYRPPVLRRREPRKSVAEPRVSRPRPTAPLLALQVGGMTSRQEELKREVRDYVGMQKLAVATLRGWRCLDAQVGYRAVDQFVHSNMTVGLGTGSTVKYAGERTSCDALFWLGRAVELLRGAGGEQVHDGILVMVGSGSDWGAPG
jgi:hypothetical protein